MAAPNAIISCQALAGTGAGRHLSMANKVDLSSSINAAVIVAHPDDETIWAGGTILANRKVSWGIFALCRRGDPDREPKFARVLKELGADGALGDLDDGPEQAPLEEEAVTNAVLGLLPRRDFDLILTHGPAGEYRRHRRHEETSRAVAGLWRGGLIRAKSLWTFAYLYDEKKGISVPDPRADILNSLADTIYAKKRLIMEKLYGFGQDSFEVRTLSRIETFCGFENPGQFQRRSKGAKPI